MSSLEVKGSNEPAGQEATELEDGVQIKPPCICIPNYASRNHFCCRHKSARSSKYNMCGTTVAQTQGQTSTVTN